MKQICESGLEKNEFRNRFAAMGQLSRCSFRRAGFCEYLAYPKQ
jgi:hypothetical protein